jgi:hypothetical protein
MLVFILVLALNGQVTTAPVTFTTTEACHKAGEAWVKESSKLPGFSKGAFVCVPAETKA